jgi:short-subunit dehydrogenase
MQISGSKVLLTGATGGIGHAIARRLHAGGAKLVLTGRRAEVLDPLAIELGATAITADLSNRSHLRQLLEDYSDVDILVANAGVPGSGHLHSLSTEQIDRALEVNLRSSIVAAHQLSQQMVQRGRGHVVFISSQAGKSAQSGSAVYSATKFGLRGFAQGMRQDLRESGVGVSCVMPGFISNAGMFADAGARLPPGVGTNTTQEVADAVVRAIERNRGEITVAPLLLRAGSALASLAPDPAAKVGRLMGSESVSRNLSDGQTDKR